MHCTDLATCDLAMARWRHLSDAAACRDAVYLAAYVRLLHTKVRTHVCFVDESKLQNQGRLTALLVGGGARGYSNP